MSTINWLELWILNEIIINGSTLSHLINNPEDESESPPWAFPKESVCRAASSRRADTVFKCLRSGLLRLYTAASLSDWTFKSCVPIDAERDQLECAQFVMGTVAIPTLLGHEKWEADFQPDWPRFWRLEHQDQDNDTNEVFVNIAYSSDDILTDLRQWFPFIFGFDESAGLVDIDCCTDFNYRATFWKFLPNVKVITWKALSAVGNFKSYLQKVDEGLYMRAYESLYRFGMRHRLPDTLDNEVNDAEA